MRMFPVSMTLIGGEGGDEGGDDDGDDDSDDGNDADSDIGFFHAK